MNPQKYFLLPADRNGQTQVLALNQITKQWQRFVPEFGGGRWEPFLEQDWGSAPMLFHLGPAMGRSAATSF